MSTKVEKNALNAASNAKKNVAWWLLVAVLAVAGIVANYYFANVAWAIRLAGGIVLACVVVFVALQTVQGQKIFAFAKEARIELYKIVWPTRQETVQTTLIVAALVVVMAFILWGIDSLLLWAINSIVT